MILRDSTKSSECISPIAGTVPSQSQTVVMPLLPAGDNTSLEVRRHGGEGETVLLLHGGPGCPDYLAEPAHVLAEAGFTAFTYDQRGVGRSPSRGPFRVQDHLSDVEAVRRCTGSDAVHLVGHSWGGLLAELYLRTHPGHVRSLLLVSPSSGVGRDWIAMEREVVAHNRRASGRAGFVAMGLLSGFSRVPGPVGNAAGRRLLARVWRNYFAEPQQAPQPSATWLNGASTRMALRTVADVRRLPEDVLCPRAEGSQVPVLVVYGDDDIYGASTEKVVQRFPRARKVSLRNCGHIPWLQNPSSFFALVEDFLRESDGVPMPAGSGAALQSAGQHQRGHEKAEGHNGLDEVEQEPADQEQRQEDGVSDSP
jgi:proline iminopeptidase